MDFEQLGLDYGLLEAISYMGFKTATPIQEKAIPKILAGSDLIACAQTGTGKTAAFLLPVLDKLSQADNSPGTKALIVVPTRELAVQIEQEIQGFSYFCGVSSFAIYGGGGGEEWTYQKLAMTQSTDIIVATPGKLISHLNLGHARFDNLQYLILDEADRMLDMGFFPDLKKIISYTPKTRQTLMFSATMPPNIRTLSNQILRNPEEISIAISKPAEGVLQVVYLVYDNQKIGLIHSLLKEADSYTSILIFSSTKRDVSEIASKLRRKKYNVEGISSDLEQKEREQVLSRFRSKETRILVATDVLSRGVDIKDINLVINYNVPGDAEDYVHRVGRTARASTTGLAITFVNDKEMYKLNRIEELIGEPIHRLPLPVELGEAPKPKAGKKRSGGGGGNRNRSNHKNKGRNKNNRNRQRK